MRETLPMAFSGAIGWVSIWYFLIKVEWIQSLGVCVVLFDLYPLNVEETLFSSSVGNE